MYNRYDGSAGGSTGSATQTIRLVYMGGLLDRMAVEIRMSLLM